jgi:hypothetical protein
MTTLFKARFALNVDEDSWLTYTADSPGADFAKDEIIGHSLVDGEKGWHVVQTRTMGVVFVPGAYCIILPAIRLALYAQAEIVDIYNALDSYPFEGGSLIDVYASHMRISSTATSAELKEFLADAGYKVDIQNL